MARSERKFTDERCKKIIELKHKVTEGNNTSFVVINEKGIDPICLEMLANAGIIALRRAKRRNMERIVLACGGSAVNSVEELKAEDLGYADLVEEHVLG
jgi:T-complex protein 1 subunit zeta